MAYNQILAERIEEILKDQRGLDSKKMFGGIGFLIHGNMACGVHKEDLILRLGLDDFETALRNKHARIFDITGKPMKGWVLISVSGLKSEKVLRGYVEKAVSFTKSLPRKQAS